MVGHAPTHLVQWQCKDEACRGAEFLSTDHPVVKRTTPCITLQVYTVTLHGEQLRTDFRVINMDEKPFDFTAALHSYIEVLSVDKAKVKGLKVGASPLGDR